MVVFLLAAPPPVGCPGVTPFAFALFWPVSFAACLSPPVPPSSHVRSTPCSALSDDLSHSFNIHPLHPVQETLTVNVPTILLFLRLQHMCPSFGSYCFRLAGLQKLGLFRHR